WRRLRFWRRLGAFLARLDRYKADRTGGPAAGAERRPRGWGFWGLLRHPRDRATVSFLVLPTGVFVARAGWLRLTCHVLPVTRLWVRERVADWHRAAAAGDARSAADSAAELARGLGGDELFDRLPARVNRLTIVPDDSLHGFPFAALPLGTGLVIDRFAVSLR